MNVALNVPRGGYKGAVRVLVPVFVVLLLSAASARASTPSTVTLRGDATHDNRVTGAPEPGLGIRWAAALGRAVSYPVVAEGRVFVTVRADSEAYGTELVALDLQTGAVQWRLPVAGTYYWSALAYGDGRLYLVNFDGQLTALTPATGASQWSVKLSQYSFSTPPVAFDGHVYLTGSGSGTTLYAVRGSDGALAWAKELPSGAGTPAVDASTVHVSMACAHAMAFDRASGAVRWEHHGDCTGGGEATPALHAGRMYPLGGNPAIYDAATGAVAGTAGAGTPAFADGAAYFSALTGGVFAVNAENWGPRWAAAVGANGDAPLLSANHLYVGSEDGYVAALSRTDGVVRWCAATGQPVVGSTGNVDRPDSGLGAGDGFLVVPAGGSLIAYGPGGVAPPVCANIAVTPPPPALAIDTTEREVVQGRATEIGGTLSGTLVLAGVAIAVQRDVWPFDGRWLPETTAKTGADGTFRFSVRPRRNTRYRAVAVGLTSGEATVYANLAATLRRSSPRGPSFRSTLTLRAPRGARLGARRASLYVLRAGTRTARRVASPRLRRVRSGVFTAAATLRYLRPKRATVVIACYRERRPDAWGKPLPIDTACGARTLRLEPQSSEL
jgi:outer membrane protein assembly factor BamB